MNGDAGHFCGNRARFLSLFSPRCTSSSVDVFKNKEVTQKCYFLIFFYSSNFLYAPISDNWLTRFFPGLLPVLSFIETITTFDKDLSHCKYWGQWCGRHVWDSKDLIPFFLSSAAGTHSLKPFCLFFSFKNTFLTTSNTKQPGRHSVRGGHEVIYSEKFVYSYYYFGEPFVVVVLCLLP